MFIEILKKKIFNNLFSIGSSHHACGILNDEADGYVLDFTRTCENVYESFGLIEDIKNGDLVSGKYAGSLRVLKSRIIVVFANFLPNLRTLSIDRWAFFHTKLGEVFIECSTTPDLKSYKCCLSSEWGVNSFEKDVDPKIKNFIHKTDKEFFLEYVERFNMDQNLRPLCENALAFPSITYAHRSVIKQLFKEKKIRTLCKFINDNKCLKNSIVPQDFIKNTTIFKKATDEIDDSPYGESSDDSSISTDIDTNN